MEKKLNYLCVGLLICLLSTTGFSRTLSPHEMATIMGTEACCTDAPENEDCKPTDLNTCVSCNHVQTGEPAGCPASGIKYSGLLRNLCDSEGITKTCVDDGEVNCTKNCDCLTSGIKVGKKCDNDKKCLTDATGWDCRACSEGDCDADWAKKPDETCR